MEQELTGTWERVGFCGLYQRSDGATVTNVPTGSGIRWSATRPSNVPCSFDTPIDPPVGYGTCLQAKSKRGRREEGRTRLWRSKHTAMAAVDREFPLADQTTPAAA